VLLFFMACTTNCTPQCARNPYWEPYSTAYFSEILIFESARDNDVDELVYGIEECYGSVVVKDGDVFVLVNEDYFCHK